MTLAKLRERTAYWQDRLNLREWTVSVRWATAKEAMENDGGCEWSTEQLLAEIRISRRSEHEHTLIHELLHLVIDGYATYKEYNENTERAINRIASALLDIGNV